MWDSSFLKTNLAKIPFKIEINWDKAPSPPKYGAINSLLTVINFFAEKSGKFTNINGEEFSYLLIKPLKRKLWDRDRKNSTIIGFGGNPLLLVLIRELFFEIYFNSHLFVETETTGRQYSPSATVIILCQNPILHSFENIFILETSIGMVPTRFRRNFRGFKLITSPFKYFLTPYKLPKTEKAFLRNNGFKEIYTNDFADHGENEISKLLQIFLKSCGVNFH